MPFLQITILIFNNPGGSILSLFLPWFYFIFLYISKLFYEENMFEWIIVVHAVQGGCAYKLPTLTSSFFQSIRGIAFYILSAL